MISDTAFKFCKVEDVPKIENFKDALADTISIWDCHHKREIEENKTVEQLKQEGLYYNRPSNELIFLRHEEHARLHGRIYSDLYKGKQHSEETIQKMRKSQLSEETQSKKDKSFYKTEEYKRKMSEVKKRLMTDELRQKISDGCTGKPKHFLGNRNRKIKILSA